ncbi:uncharacterized protein E0L32_011418 [Thyridium curvatum]|uniref:Transcription factor n=1 Tax=Thyridium curvatum TaxID=1093900 RepID=A0A507BHK9_9PEZI|nr:uncharacterized protein E0L32_011418 [Thyridium curvatum]TPX18866.1 hypothetical protein E0L32_011418 [Thyridium curvatum]
MDPTLLIHDVQEKEVTSVKPPSFPLPKSGLTGFPEHKKRTRISAFKQKKQAQEAANAAGPAPAPAPAPDAAGSSSHAPPASTATDERRKIDLENKERIRNMSPTEIAEAREELMSGLDPALIQMLLKRANLDDAAAKSPFPESAEASRPAYQAPSIEVEDTDRPVNKDTDSKPKKTVSFAADPEPSGPPAAAKPPAPFYDEDAPPAVPPPDLFPIDSQQAQQAHHGHKHGDHDHDHDHADDDNGHSATHFPSAPPLPDLDPADPDFLQHLHDKYFPNLPADPAKLAWMAPLPTAHSPADRDSPYYPRQDSLPVSQLRFDFRGALLPPRIARAVPATRGLHHHAEAPEAAGYTVLELARLARSSVPAQRCIAFQTLGRILFRLGRGEWGAGDDEMAMGLWRCFQEGRVLETLNEAAAVEEGRGHQGARAYAIEAVWLYEKGGWRERWRGR